MLPGPETPSEEYGGHAPALLRGLYAPLQHLVAAAELLERQRLTPEARACARAVLQSGRTALTVIEDLKALTEIGADDVSAIATAPAGVMEDVEALWRLQTAPSAGRLLLSCTAPAEVQVTLDPRRLKQAMNALIGRALDAGQAGVVEASLQIAYGGPSGGCELAFTVSQNLPPRRPVEEDASLALAAAIAERLGGRLVRMPHHGQGEQTCLTIPVALVETAPEQAVDDTAVLPAQTHVLIVDDNATNRMVAAALCEMFGCSTETAEDGVEAVEAARVSRFDLILMDIKMPRMDGVEATRAIRRLPGALGRTPIVALTANGDAEAAKVYLASGMDGVVEKPIKPDKLLATLQAVLDPQTDEPHIASDEAAA